jgi:hypothetical protein
MENMKLQSNISSKSISELADELSDRVKQYRAKSMEPDSTQSILDLDFICMVADEIAMRLKS